MYEIVLKAGHFGLVVGSTALSVTWPSVVAWMKWREGTGPLPATAIDVRADDVPDPLARPRREEAEEGDGADESTLDIARDVVEKGEETACCHAGECPENRPPGQVGSSRGIPMG